MSFRYENIGYREQTYLAGHTVEDSTGAQTKTGVAFYQTAKDDNNPYPTMILPSLPEIWVKFDVYRDVTQWRLYCNSDDGGGFLGLWAYSDGRLYLRAQGKDKHQSPFTATNGLHTVLFHAVADATAGLAEYWWNGEKITSYAGNVNNGKTFAKLCFQSDNANALFSNIIISDTEIDLNEDAASKSLWIQPILTANGNFGEDDFAVRASTNRTDTYCAFDAYTSNYADYFPVNGYIDLYFNTPIIVHSMYLYTAKKYLGANGILYWSDDGENYTQGGTWFDTEGTSTHAIVNCIENYEHNYWRLQVSQNPLQRPSSQSAFSNINIFATASGKRTVKVSFDTCRRINNVVTLTADTCRRLIQIRNITARFDVCRNLGKRIIISADTQRKLYYGIKVKADTERRIKNCIKIYYDTERKLSQRIKIAFDTERRIKNIVKFKSDTCRLIPYSFVYQPTETPPTPSVNNPNNRLVSAQISIKEQSVCDDITLEVANCSLLPFAPLQGGLLDYDFSDYMVKSTSHQNIIMTINSMINWQKYISTAMRYPYFDEDGEAETATADDQPRIKIGGNSIRYGLSIVGGKRAFANTKHPTATAKKHLRYIADCLGLDGYHCWFDDFVPSNGCGNEIIGYLSLLSNMFSWSKEVPWREINVFVRDNVLYAVQRGHEPNEIDITNFGKTRPQIRREVLSLSKTYLTPLGATIVKDYYLDYESNNVDENGNLKQYNVGNSTITITVSGTSEVTSEEVINPDGSKHSVEYEYNKITPRHSQIREKHTFTDKDGNAETKELWHTTLGNGRTITDALDEDGNVSNSVISTSKGEERKILGTFTIGGERVYKYHYLVADSFGNGAKIDFDSEQDTTLFPVYSTENVEYTPPSIEAGTHTGMTVKAPANDPLQKKLFEEICEYNAKIQETVTVDLLCTVQNGVPEYGHIINFLDRIIMDGNVYFLAANTVKITTHEFRQSLQLIRWY